MGKVTDVRIVGDGKWRKYNNFVKLSDIQSERKRKEDYQKALCEQNGVSFEHIKMRGLYEELNRTGFDLLEWPENINVLYYFCKIRGVWVNCSTKYIRSYGGMNKYVSWSGDKSKEDPWLQRSLWQ